MLSSDTKKKPTMMASKPSNFSFLQMSLVIVFRSNLLNTLTIQFRCPRLLSNIRIETTLHKQSIEIDNRFCSGCIGNSLETSEFQIHLIQLKSILG